MKILIHIFRYLTNPMYRLHCQILERQKYLDTVKNLLLCQSYHNIAKLLYADLNKPKEFDLFI